jgi:hypothetical protein
MNMPEVYEQIAEIHRQLAAISLKMWQTREEGVAKHGDFTVDLTISEVRRSLSSLAAAMKALEDSMGVEPVIEHLAEGEELVID